MIRLASWILLLLHFFMDEPYREQLLALQTVCCTLMPELKPLHIVTFFTVVIYFVRIEHQPVFWISIIHHAIVCCCILGEYYFQKWHAWSWVILCWSIRWLSSIDTYRDHPARACLRCIVFALVAQKQFVKTFKDGFKWSWILLVHEIAWLALPFQMLYEVYKVKPSPEDSTV